jgi:hypothetical protein
MVVSGAPVETKKKWKEETKNKQNIVGNNTITTTTNLTVASKVTPSTQNLEQIFDQLSEMHAKGHPNLFEALTCFDETYITCLDSTACKEVLEILAR